MGCVKETNSFFIELRFSIDKLFVSLTSTVEHGQLRVPPLVMLPNVFGRGPCCANVTTYGGNRWLRRQCRFCVIGFVRTPETEVCWWLVRALRGGYYLVLDLHTTPTRKRTLIPSNTLCSSWLNHRAKMNNNLYLELGRRLRSSWGEMPNFLTPLSGKEGNARYSKSSRSYVVHWVIASTQKQATAVNRFVRGWRIQQILNDSILYGHNARRS